ncbi:threonine-phosphate decarboxylase [Ligaoa zhengdingensis]|uniref:pyridoxal phosphate-dependent aminotransferase n=1 Tax=Ligaoa zhengdingensis TaxID=2763658 RepID=UPI0031BBBDFE
MIELIHGGDIYSAHERGLEAVLDFSANINPLGMPDGVREALASGLGSCEAYPDPLCRALTAALSQSLSQPAERILCGNGASDLIYRLVQALCPKTALVLAPCFEEYEQALSSVGCTVRRHLLREEEDFRLTERILGDLTEEIDLFFLCNPNNPTGQTVDQGLLRRILQHCRERGIVLALDECFNDFLDNPEAHTMRDSLAQNDNLILFYAFTKMYAIPGLRLGYCLCADRGLLERMYHCASPWNVSAPAQLAGIQALREEDYRRRTAALIRSERAFLREGLAKLGCTVYGSHANYLFFRLHVPHLRERLEPRGILLRDCGNFKGLSGEFCRIAVRGRTDNEALLAAMGELT